MPRWSKADLDVIAHNSLDSYSSFHHASSSSYIPMWCRWPVLPAESAASPDVPCAVATGITARSAAR